PWAPGRRRKASARSMLRAATKLTSTVKKSNGPSASLSGSFRQSTPSRLVTRASARSAEWSWPSPTSTASTLAAPCASSASVNPPVDAPTSTARAPRTAASRPKRASAASSFPPARLTAMRATYNARRRRSSIRQPAEDVGRGAAEAVGAERDSARARVAPDLVARVRGAAGAAGDSCLEAGFGRGQADRGQRGARDDADQERARDDRQAGDLLLAHDLRGLFEGGVGADAENRGAHAFADEGVPLGCPQVLPANDPCQSAIVEHQEVVDAVVEGEPPRRSDHRVRRQRVELRPHHLSHAAGTDFSHDIHDVPSNRKSERAWARGPLVRICNKRRAKPIGCARPEF